MMCYLIRVALGCYLQSLLLFNISSLFRVEFFLLRKELPPMNEPAQFVKMNWLRRFDILLKFLQGNNRQRFSAQEGRGRRQIALLLDRTI